MINPREVYLKEAVIHVCSTPYGRAFIHELISLQDPIERQSFDVSSAIHNAYISGRESVILQLLKMLKKSHMMGVFEMIEKESIDREKAYQEELKQQQEKGDPNDE